MTSLKDFSRKHGTLQEIELCVKYLQKALVDNFERNCPQRTVRNTKSTLWWTPKLQGSQVRGKLCLEQSQEHGICQSDWKLPQDRRAQRIYKDCKGEKGELKEVL